MKLTKTLDTEIKQAIHSYWTAYASGDLETWISFLPWDYRNIGTTNEEIWNNRDQIYNYTSRMLDQMVGQFEFRNVKTEIIPYEPYFMVHELGDIFIKAGDDWNFYSAFRLSSLMQKNNGKWNILHQHGSYPDSRTDEGEAFAFGKIKRENTELRDAVKRRTLELEHKNREMEIEVALERTRTQIMRMQHSDELLEISKVFHEQLLLLGIDSEFSFVWLPNEEKGDHLFWATWMEEKGDNRHFHARAITYPLDMTEPYTAACFVDWRSGVPVHEHFIKPEDVESFFASWAELLEGADKLKPGFFPDGIYYTEAFMKYGCFGIDIRRPLSQQEKDVLCRFAIEFERAYTRFLDLQKAEAQAREAQIELSLEKIRALVTSMQESTDLLDIMVNIRSEFVALGHEAHYFWYMHWLPDKYEKAMTSGDGTQVGMIMTLPRHIHGDIPLVANWERGDEPTLIFPMDVDTAVEYIEKMITLGDFEQVDPHAPTLDDIRHIGGLTFIMARTSQGEIGYSLPGIVHSPPEEAVTTLARFAAVFDLAYKRFEDLKKAEKDLLEIKAARQRAEEALADLKATQAQLIQSEKMASLGELTAGIAHEIQNPLNFVNNFSVVSAELIDEMKRELAVGSWQLAGEIADDLKQNLERIHHHGNRADAIVKGMLQHSRTSTGQKEPTDINDLVDEYLRLAYHGMRAKDKSFNADFKTEFAPDLPKINVVPQDIGRVLLNLINNAFYAVSAKSQLAGTYHGASLQEYKPTVTISTKNHGNTLEISVNDNGPGIPDDIRNKIFQPFFTTKPSGEGTGLGLSLSYDIIKAHGGHLSIESEPGSGARFVFHLPANN